MLLQMPRPDEVVLKEFELWFDKVFEREFKPVLYNFNYCHKAWFNHLCKKKQVEVAPYYPEINPIDFIPISIKNIKEYNTYTNFVKSEKQCGNGCKTRCICSPGPAYKYIMGPITYELEQIMKKHIHGYQVPENWEALEKFLDHMEICGLIATVQLDGKSFDMTQNIHLKRIVDHKIYRYVKQFVHHVDQNVFEAVATAEERYVVPNVRVDGKVKSFGSVMLRGQVFSGSMDTTLMNTLRMSMFVRFCMDRAGVPGKVLVKGDDTSVFISPVHIPALVKSIGEIFCTEEEWLANPEIIKGLGLISKFIKIGAIS